MEIREVKPLPTRKKMPVKQISERFVEEAFNLDEQKEYKTLEISSSLGGNVKFSYEATVNWGDFDVNSLVDKLCMLAEKTSGIKLYDFQKEFQKRIFESVLLNDGEEITALFSRQSGKTQTVAHTAATLLIWMPILARMFPEQLGIYKKGFKIGLFAPTNEQAYTTHSRMDECLSGESADSILSDVDINSKKKYSDGVLSVIGPEETMPSGKKYPQFHSFCKLQSAAKQTKIESKTYDLILMDEMQEIDSMKISKSIRPMGSSTNSTIVGTGTPIPNICDFYNAIVRNKRKQTQMKIRNHFEYDWRHCAKFNPRYKSFVTKEIERLGEDSDAFRMSYKLEWLLEKGMAITPQMFEEYMKSPSDKFEYSADENYVYVGGLDLAKESDSTVFTIAKIEKDNVVEKVDEEGDSEFVEKYLKQVVNWIEMRKDNWESQIDVIVETVETYKLQILAIDSTGVGDPIVDRLEKIFDERDIKCSIFPVTYTLKEKHNMATLFYEEMRNHRIKIPCHQMAKKTKRFQNFLDQFYTCEKVYKGSYMQLKHSDKIKDAHDDYVNSLLLLCYGVEQNIFPKIKSEPNMFFNKSGKRSMHSQRYQEAVALFKKQYSVQFRRQYK